MAENFYHFITHWQVGGQIEEVANIIGDVETLSVWWPSVYLDVNVVYPGDEQGLGKIVSLYTKGWLPYTLRWQFEVVEIDYPQQVKIAAVGDFIGFGVWQLKQNGPRVNITFDWQIEAENNLLKNFSFLLKPIFSLNHEWAMQMGEKSLKLEIARRRGQKVAHAPLPTFPHSLFYPVDHERSTFFHQIGRALLF